MPQTRTLPGRTTFKQIACDPQRDERAPLLRALAAEPALASALLVDVWSWTPPARARGLALLHPFLRLRDERDRVEVAIGQLPAADRAAAYGLLAAHAADAATHARWLDAELSAIDDLTGGAQRRGAILAAAPHTPAAQWERLLGCAEATRPEAQRVATYCALLPTAPEHLLARLTAVLLDTRQPAAYQQALIALSAAAPDRLLPTIRARLAAKAPPDSAAVAQALDRRAHTGRSWQGPHALAFEPRSVRT